MIAIIADLHGLMRLQKFKNELPRFLSKNDFLIIAGDAGIVWDNDKNDIEVQTYFNSQKFTTLFVDGNHENFSLLNKFPIIELYGGKTHKISDKIYHLLRGEVYLLDEKKIFVFGGAFSAKKLTKTSPVFIWDEEMPNEKEYLNGLNKMKLHNNDVDIIITHTAPLSIIKYLKLPYIEEERKLYSYLDYLYKNVNYRKWYLGHFHKDISMQKINLVYNNIITEK